MTCGKILLWTGELELFPLIHNVVSRSRLDVHSFKAHISSLFSNLTPAWSAVLATH